MASLLSHAALPLVLAPVFREEVEPGARRRVVVLAVLCSCVADLDIVSYLFQIRAVEPLGHRGLSHSLFIAALLAIGVALVGLRSLKMGSRGWGRATVLLFGAAASHGLLDTLTVGDVGVALFAPLTQLRVLLPLALRPLPACPLGVTEYFGQWGFWVVANELLYVLVPLGILSWLIRGWRDGAEVLSLRLQPAIQASAGWALAVFLLRSALPAYFAPVKPRILRAATGDDEDPNLIPHDALPGGRLVTKLDELKKLGVFDRDLEPGNPLWSSSFFPWWFGSEGGRWQEGSPRLAWRTLVGFDAPTESEAKSWESAAASGDAKAQERLFALAPTEKLDIAYHHLDFPYTHAALLRGHNGHPRFWYGRCNGVAAAAMANPEPFRVVDLIGVDGVHVKMHPNDIKSLMAVAYYVTENAIPLGDPCSETSFDSGATCSMNPASLVLAVLNRIGLAHQTFIMDVLPTPANQYYPVARARVNLVGAPRAADLSEVMEDSLQGHVSQLQDVEITVVGSSTELSYLPANVIDPNFKDGSRYERVGLTPVPFVYQATLALNASGELVGGRWNGDPGNGPDLIVFIQGGPKLEDGQTSKLKSPEVLGWPLIRELTRASVETGDAMPVVDLRTQCEGRCPP